MLVRITPPGRAAKVFRVSGVKRSWHIDGGCAAASIPLTLTPEDVERILLARVDLFGPLGLEWSGMVWRRPRHGEPLECAGLANALTFNRREALYADTRLTPWRASAISIPDGWTAGMGVGNLTVNINAGTYATVGTATSFLVGPFATTSAVRVTGTVAGLAAQTEIRVATYLADATGYSLATTLSSNGAFDVPISRAGVGYMQLILRTNASYAPATDTAVTISGLTLHAVSGIATGSGESLTPEAVIAHVCDSLPTWALPAGAAYRGHIGVSGVTIDSLAFPDTDADDKRKADAVTELSAHHFGFYPRRIAGRAVTVPVYEAVETTPTLTLDVSRLADDSLRDRSAESLANSYIARYANSTGGTRFTTVADASAENYLNDVGYSIAETVDASWTSSATVAAAAATTYAGEARANDTEGSATILTARLANGRPAPALLCMPGRMVRVRGMGRERNLVVSSVEADGASVRVSFAPKATDLQYLTAVALGR